MDNFVLLSPEQIRFMNEVIDYILEHPFTTTAGKVKQKYHLNEAAYQNIMDMAMPFIRAHNLASYWKWQFTSLKETLKRRLRFIDGDTLQKFKNDIEQILVEKDPGPLNQSAKLELDDAVEDYI